MTEQPVADPPRENLQALAALHGAGRFADAHGQAMALAEAYPASPSLSNILGVLAIALQKPEEAISHLQRALELKPEFSEVRANLGNLLRETGRLEEARQAYEIALQYQPQNAGFLSGLANVLSELGRAEEAITLYQRAISANPQSAEARNNLGNVYSALGRPLEALTQYREAIRLRQNFADAYSNMGNVLRGLGQPEAALSVYKAALAFGPNMPGNHINLASFCAAMGDSEQAARHYAEAVRLEPGNISARAASLYHAGVLCQWDKATLKSLDTLRRATFEPRAKMTPSPFIIMTLVDDPVLQLQAAENFVKREASQMKAAEPVSRLPGGDRIRLGYFSADFHNHATMHLIARLFELHDRSRFEVHAFSFGPDNGEDEYRNRLKANVDGFHDVREKSAEEIGRFSRGLNIDIAVDLKGHTRDSRPRIFLQRAAPIQVNYLGHPGTCGSAEWDYILADRVIIPPEAERFYSEKLATMPDSYQVNDDRRAISNRVFTRTECGLPDEGFVFCCFNNAYKITPAEFDIWMRLLEEVEGSVLWLLKATDTTVANLRNEAKIRGVVPQRLIFAERMPIADHLARHALADLFLDTFVVNAHTTASDALWAGLPVLTLAGKSFAARVSASLLHAVRLGELATTSAQAYENMALELARDGERLAALKARLRATAKTSPLFDTALYTANLERLYEKMIANYREGVPPHPIAI